MPENTSRGCSCLHEFGGWQNEVRKAGELSVESAVAECAAALASVRVQHFRREHDGFFKEISEDFSTNCLGMLVRANQVYLRESVDMDVPQESPALAVSALEMAQSIAGRLDDFALANLEDIRAPLVRGFCGCGAPPL